MTVQDTTPSVTHVGDGIDTSFPFTFRVDDVAWLSVDFVTNFSQFLINTDQDANPGGSAEYTVAPPSLQELTILRTTPKNQLLDYTRYDAFDSESHEDALDKLTMLAQDMCLTLEDHIADVDIHFSDAPADGMDYVRNNNAWTLASILGVTDHLLLTNIGVNSHAVIDAHIADPAIHFGDAVADGNPYWRVNNAWVQADHLTLQNIGANSHAAIDAHIADGSIHFTEVSISHLNIQNIGGNSHAVIDTHLANATIHFVDAPADGIYYNRRNNDWEPADNGGGFSGLGEWRWNTGTTPPPASGRVRFDNANPVLATEFYLSTTNDGGTDVTTFLSLLTSGDLIYLQDKGNSSHFILVELSSVVNNVSFFTFGINNIVQEGGPFSNNTRMAVIISIGAGAGVTDHDLLTNNGGAGSHAIISAHIADASIHFTAGSIDHGSIAGLADDDHLQYALLLGRAGGQTLIGGTGAGDDLTLVGTSGALAGARVNMNSPVEFGPYEPTGAAYGFNYAATESFTGVFIGGGLNFSGNITFSNSTFIYESFRGAPTITTAVNPGFAAYTVLQALPRLAAGSGAGHNPLNPLIINAGAQVANPFSGTRSVNNVVGMNFGCQLRGEANGAVLNCTSWIGLQVLPAWHTVAGSIIDFGTIIGMDVRAPAPALFAQNNGTERMAAFYGMQVANPTINNVFGTAPVAAIRSAINFAGGSNRYFLLNAGTAPSDMGAAHMYFDDNFGVAFGGAGVTNFDSWISWNGPGNYHRTYFFSSSSALRWSSPANNRFLFDSDGGSTTGEYNFNCAKFSLGANIGAVGNQVGQFVAGTRATQVGGEWADFLLTQAANITVDHAMGGVFGWAINAPSITIGTGSVTTAGALTVGGNVNQGSVNRFGVRIISNPSGGSGVNAALWVTAGLSRFDGVVDINAPIALGGGVAPTLGTIGGAGPTVAAQAQWVQIDINGVAHWVPAWV